MIFTAEHVRSVIDNWRDEWGQIDLSGVVVEGFADLRHANLRYANLYGANLYSVKLRDAKLRYANLYSADLGYAKLRNADLRSADLRSADLRNADLRSADLRYAKLGFAYLDGADLSGARGVVALYGVGEHKRMIFAYYRDEIRIQCGCANGTSDEIKARIDARYGQSARGAAYKMAIDTVVMVLQAQS